MAGFEIGPSVHKPNVLFLCSTGITPKGRQKSLFTVASINKNNRVRRHETIFKKQSLAYSDLLPNISLVGGQS